MSVLQGKVNAGCCWKRWHCSEVRAGRARGGMEEECSPIAGSCSSLLSDIKLLISCGGSTKCFWGEEKKGGKKKYHMFSYKGSCLMTWMKLKSCYVEACCAAQLRWLWARARSRPVTLHRPGEVQAQRSCSLPKRCLLWIQSVLSPEGNLLH